MHKVTWCARYLPRSSICAVESDLAGVDPPSFLSSLLQAEKKLKALNRRTRDTTPVRVFLFIIAVLVCESVQVGKKWKNKREKQARFQTVILRPGMEINRAPVFLCAGLL